MTNDQSAVLPAATQACGCAVCQCGADCACANPGVAACEACEDAGCTCGCAA